MALLRRWTARVHLCLALALLAGCASLPDASQRPIERALPAAPQSPLGRLASASVPDASLSGFRLITSGLVSLNVRLALIERAQSSIDLQVYRFRGDRSGLRVMRALRDAATRGVRVRVLVDDLYTVGDDLLLLGLAAHAGVEVRLFNPFNFGRDSLGLRLMGAFFGAERLHRRMHNKLLVVDGVLAVAGGRNIGDEYFDNQGEQVFFDLDVLMAGAVVPQLTNTFDPYWNSPYSHDVRVVLGEQQAGESLRSVFATRVERPCGDVDCPPGGEPAVEESADWAAFVHELDAERVDMHMAHATAAADPPSKVESEPAPGDAPQAARTPPPPGGVGSSGRATLIQEAALAAAGAEVRMRVALALRQAREEITIVSPYLVPGPAGLQALKGFRERGVRVTLMTNSLAATDEPLVHVGYRRYRGAILREGVALYEWSPVRSGRVFRSLLGGKTVLRLHAKCAVIDRQFVYLGSMNFDPRSRDYNTEFGLMIHSPGLAEEIHDTVQRMAREGSHRVQLAADGRTLRWTYGDDDSDGGFEPDTDFWSRFLLDLLAPFVPEQML